MSARWRSPGEEPVDLARRERVLELTAVAINGVARDLHDPVVRKRRDRHDLPAVLPGLPHLDRRSHRRLRHVGDHEVELPAHFDMAVEDLLRPPHVIAEGSGVVGKRVVDFGVGPMVLKDLAERSAVGLVVDQRRDVRALHDAGEEYPHESIPVAEG